LNCLCWFGEHDFHAQQRNIQAATKHYRHLSIDLRKTMGRFSLVLLAAAVQLAASIKGYQPKPSVLSSDEQMPAVIVRNRITMQSYFKPAGCATADKAIATIHRCIQTGINVILTGSFGGLHKRHGDGLRPPSLVSVPARKRIRPTGPSPSAPLPPAAPSPQLQLPAPTFLLHYTVRATAEL
jgi:hypothetical protein